MKLSHLPPGRFCWSDHRKVPNVPEMNLRALWLSVLEIKFLVWRTKLGLTIIKFLWDFCPFMGC